MESLRICMLAMLALSAAVILKQWRSDLLPLLRMGATVLLATLLLAAVTPLVEFLRELTELSAISEYTGFLFRALGVTLLTQCCADLCRECGEVGIASGVEIAGKTEILVLSLPLIEEILTTARALLSMGG